MQDKKNGKLERAIKEIEKKKDELAAQKKSLQKEPNHKTDLEIFPNDGFDNIINNLQQIEAINHKINALNYALNTLTNL